MNSLQTTTFIFKLRRNISLEGDLTLAEMELCSFFPEGVCPISDLDSLVHDVVGLTGLQGITAPTAYLRRSGKQAYRASGMLHLLPTLIKQVSFIQQIYCLTANTAETREFLAEAFEKLGPVISWQVINENIAIQAVPHYAVSELADVITAKSVSLAAVRDNLDLMLDALMGRNTTGYAVKLAETALSALATTSHLSHDIHYYKAKFFPRMARSMLNICSRRLGDESARVLDNFAGSGTTMLEASILGLPSVGMDIDPLSVLIARAKLEVLGLRSDMLAVEASQAQQEIEKQLYGQPSLFDVIDDTPQEDDIIFPAWLMKNRRMSKEIAGQINKEIGILRRVVAKSDLQVRDLFRVLMSDAIARKIRMRFLGTGVGRFSLTFAQATIVQIFVRSLKQYVKVVAMCEWLRDTLNLPFADAAVISADTRCIPANLGQFDIILTSPPYLPASSGRESYAKARAVSLIALGMRSHEDVDALVDDSVGSMDGIIMNAELLNEEERVAVEWLRQDELRTSKADATARYFLDLRQSFSEMYRVLRPGGLAVVISGKESTFYRFSTREVLFVVHSAKLLAEEAQNVGFEIEMLQDVQLNKSNKNARPRSLDDYYETLIMLRKPLS